ncbi:MAG: gliding motility-associated lipoprotein, partial [Chitinophagaceae bacterium]
MRKNLFNLVPSFKANSYICPIPKYMTLKNHYYTLIALSALSLASCGIIGKKDKGGMLPNDGQVHGIAPGTRYTLPKPPGMIYVPQGTFHMGPSDEDPAYAFSARNRSVSISGFWMDATEITNNEYRQFIYWVRDSVAAKKLGAPYVKDNPDGTQTVDFAKMRTLKWNDPKIVEQLNDMIIPEPDRLRGKKELDPTKIVYQVERFDLKAAAQRDNAGKPRSQFVERYPVSVYPDTLVWMRDFSYSYNEPMTKRYFSHPAFGNYPVVGVNWKMAEAFCNWRTLYLNNYLESKGRTQESDFRLPTEAQWEYAARGGRSQSMFPWGNYYLRNKKGCLLANFKPGRGNYPEDGGFYTV